MTSGTDGHVVFQSAVRSIIDAGLASSFREASDRYSDRLVFVQCNVVTRASLDEVLQAGSSDEH